jgi:hypothetical protein
MEPSDHDKSPLCKILYFVGGMALLADGEYTVDWKSHGASIALLAYPTYTQVSED